jgi:hypothetical protein
VGGFWEPGLGVRAALVVWLAYAVIDLAVLAASGMTARLGILVSVSLLTKLAAVYLGALAAGRSP